ncbi:MAG: hypothetical protein NTV68_14595 [Methanomicrobiales archaeon]|nr:hypothetical protein [Methanomicrobiales archaeon]
MPTSTGNRVISPGYPRRGAGDDERQRHEVLAVSVTPGPFRKTTARIEWEGDRNERFEMRHRGSG